jgi:hypothetical protein
MADTVDESQRRLEGWKLDATHAVVQRDPWIISCESWMDAGKYIALTINPEQLDFNIPLRVAKDAGNNCGYMYIWRRRRTRSLNNTMQVSFNLSSGNIFPQFDLSTKEQYALAQQYTGMTPPSEEMAADHRHGQREYMQASVGGLYSAKVPIGVQNLYAMLALANEWRVRKSGVVKQVENSYEDARKVQQQTANRIVMGISTLVFPRLLLYGWFTPDGIQFSMSADNPGEFTMSFTLQVVATTPTLGFDAWRQLTDSYNTNMFKQQQTLDWMADRLNAKALIRDHIPQQDRTAPFIDQGLPTA